MRGRHLVLAPPASCLLPCLSPFLPACLPACRSGLVAGGQSIARLVVHPFGRGGRARTETVRLEAKSAAT